MEHIVAALAPLEREGVACTNALARLWPGAEAWREVACGVLSIALPEPRASRLLWFRPEVVQTVSWGGDPRKPAEPDPSGPRLHPRRSFARWQEEVRLTSIAWTPAEVEVATDLRRYAIEIDLARQVVRERRAVQARDDLMAVVSHDLRNPLGVIQMQAAVLLRLATGHAAQTRRLRASAERIQRSIDRMNALIHDLLDIAKIEAGRFSIEPEPIDAAELIEEALGILRPLTEGKALRLTHHVSPRLRVRADRERIFQVLSNLVGNAVKFTPPQGAIHVTADVAGDDALFTVADTGPGIPADQIPHIFDRGWQAKRSGRESAGLGLYIVHGIVAAHRGRVWVESVVGQGSAFRFTLPRA
jgi:signal transduction histidine kinase